MRSEEDIWKQHKKIIDDYALEMYHKIRIRWEEMNPKTTTYQKWKEIAESEG